MVTARSAYPSATACQDRGFLRAFQHRVKIHLYGQTESEHIADAVIIYC
ncbi:hypothetical protein DFR52_101499 [Hoeflea marina]|uniref:Uncharacterized protein n=1 Tax=Hoeflea marina TaxID=274592 RepID=A0A317PQQ0_9HYPH|nr:hypothetical protein DFR52_101499 [Hoeflea marina]